jgi:hypothetical protein
MLSLKKETYEDDFLRIINEKNITSPIKVNNKYKIDTIFDDYNIYDKYNILSNTILFIDKLKNNFIIKSRKRKRCIEYDIKKIRCHCCNKDITKLFNNSNLFSHKCFNK